MDSNADLKFKSGTLPEDAQISYKTDEGQETMVPISDLASVFDNEPIAAAYNYRKERKRPKWHAINILFFEKKEIIIVNTVNKTAFVNVTLDSEATCKAFTAFYSGKARVFKYSMRRKRISVVQEGLSAVPRKQRFGMI